MLRIDASQWEIKGQNRGLTGKRKSAYAPVRCALLAPRFLLFSSFHFVKYSSSFPQGGRGAASLQPLNQHSPAHAYSQMHG